MRKTVLGHAAHSPRSPGITDHAILGRNYDLCNKKKSLLGSKRTPSDDGGAGIEKSHRKGGARHYSKRQTPERKKENEGLPRVLQLGGGLKEKGKTNNQ